MSVADTAPPIRARSSTSRGIPARARRVPGGRSRTAAAARTAVLATVPATRADTACWPDRCSPSSAAAATPAQTRRGSNGEPPPCPFPARRATPTSITSDTADPTRTSANTTRQCTACTRSPETSGPTTDGSNHARVSDPNMRGRSSSRTDRAMTTYRTTESIPPPIPWSSRPATKTPIVGAATHSASPRRNAAPPNTSGCSGPLRSAHVPPRVMPTSPVIIVAAKASEYHRSAPRSRATTGRAVVTAKTSKATKVISPNTPTTRSREPGAQSRSGAAGARAEGTRPGPEVTGSRPRSRRVERPCPDRGRFPRPGGRATPRPAAGPAGPSRSVPRSRTGRAARAAEPPTGHW
ncbi:hypothetical protein BDW27_102530 [Nocardiopsis sp. L17-MgMaSL7]|nr:hypothetical protein BDW27_102530 [Nocardiopsis sp. L17-MgMaSL7]